MATEVAVVVMVIIVPAVARAVVAKVEVIIITTVDVVVVFEVVPREQRLRCGRSSRSFCSGSSNVIKRVRIRV